MTAKNLKDVGSYSDPPPRIHLTSERSGWRDVEFQEISFPRFGSFHHDPAQDTRGDLAIGWTLGPLKVREVGKKSFEDVSLRPVVYMPGMRQYSEWNGSQISRVLRISEEFITRAVGSPAKSFNRRRFEAEIFKIEHLIYLVRADVQAESPAGPIAAELLISEILNVVFSGDERHGSLVRGSNQVRRVCELIDAKLSEPLSLLDLASEAGMSTRHLGREFRSATGYPPHEYIMRRRVERARELIGAGPLSLTDIALIAGFSSHAHMTVTFQRILGAAPSHFRNK